MFEILVVDDDLRMRQLIGEILTEEGYDVSLVGDGREALLLLKEKEFDVVITDLKMPFVDGIEILAFARKVQPDCPVVLVTANGTVESAIAAMKNGAYDYLQKPFDPEELELLVARAVERRWLVHENKKLAEEVKKLSGDDFVGASRVITEMKELVEKVAPLDTTVLIQGETGTGKELVAKMIHRRSRRAKGVFLPVHCGALAETLLESELFGHEAGSFTGAQVEKKGLFEAAAAGTIFLDEINSTSPAFQVKLLRVLQENMVMRVGSARPISIDVRVVAATNVDLGKEVAAGRFRQDLYYRLNVVTVGIPSLKERRDDIPLIAYHFLSRFAGKFGKEIASFSPPVIERLMAYVWPGNVRELENVVERAVILEAGKEISLKSLVDELKDGSIDPFSCIGLMRLDEMEKFLIARTLRLLDGQKAKAAEALGIDGTTLWRKMKKYCIE
ncbi:MAG TPA: sigma-54-dependent Fis family transcriptional regulator [Desulfobulbaceae bacterium]|nr:MAG: sigma-54-dependent Fis family transcriptional regulator [Deltaproteobacteria bacterium RIFOXYD12_FULL_53_23]HCC54287.1 sigma-54-dependent Fis family transcriptional regulator [Desulfobulbaceae bacterium]